jgi:hypothetical protein
MPRRFRKTGGPDGGLVKVGEDDRAVDELGHWANRLVKRQGEQGEIAHPVIFQFEPDPK